MFCVKCGIQISDTAKFCPNCGSAQELQNQNYEATTSTEAFYFHNWIVENGLESCESLLKAKNLDTIDVLMTLTESDIDKLGIESIGAKRKILNGVQKLKLSASVYVAPREIAEKDCIPSHCPNCGEIWGMEKETTGAGNTLGKALVGGLLLGPLGVIGGAAFGNKTTVFICNKCGFKKEYKSSLVKGMAKGIKDIFK